jgi:hypothetical protein
MVGLGHGSTFFDESGHHQKGSTAAAELREVTVS